MKHSNDPQDLYEAMWQSLGLVLQTVAQQTNAQRLLQDLRVRMQSARIVGIHPLTIDLLEHASGILEIETKK